MGLFSRRAVPAPVSPETHLPPSRKSAQFDPQLIHTIRTWGMGMSSYGAMYSRQPAVRACVDFLARNVAQLNGKVYERAGNTDRIENNNHPLAVLLRYPNPATTRYAHMFSTVADIAVYDLAYWLKDRPEFPRSVTRIAPSQMQTETVEGRTVYRGPDGNRIPRNRLVVFHGYNPDGSGAGVSPLETLRRVLLEEQASQQHRENFWRNAARQHGTIERPSEAPPWSQEAKARFASEWEAAQTGTGNAGRTAILEEGMKWNAASFSPKDSEWIAGRMLTRKETAITYGIAPALVGAGDDTKSNLEANHRHLYQDTLGPWLRMLQDEIELQLLPGFEPMSSRGSVYVEFNLAEKLKGSFEEQQRALTTAVGVPHMSVNEGRARVNLPRIDEPWADLPVQPLNVMYGGQPAVTVPTADPGTAAAVPHTKAMAKVDPEAREEAAAEHTERLKEFFDRQERSVLSALGKKSVDGLDRERWDRELTGVLRTQALITTTSYGHATAVQLRGRFDSSRVREWLDQNSARTASGVNETTFAAIEAAEDLDGVRDVFGDAKTNRARNLGVSLATVLLAFSMVEAGRHTADASDRDIVKTWRVTSANSRHPEMDGQTVPVWDVFSNGARWPGDPSLGADGAAGCLCILDIGERS